ncbi:Nuclear envelope morphology 1 [Lecanosticta acicola]|uniref:Nuclear envelope morphology 1 n=1 Tax=Lecanosticta acicola TaxID=111012 RepID=A0AAI8Z5X2_9PEZI|nr:Nuclear envelope morphology 1 [Lecanosticta acicola]
MNSLNIVQRLTTTPPPSPPRSRTSSSPDVEPVSSESTDGSAEINMDSVNEKLSIDKDLRKAARHNEKSQEDYINEKTPLLSSGDSGAEREAAGRGWRLPSRIGDAVLYGVRVVFSTVTAPVRYVIACFYDEEGRFSAVMPLRQLKSLFSRKQPKSTARAIGLSSVQEEQGEDEDAVPRRRFSSRRSPSVDSNASTVTAGSSEGERDDSPARHTRSKTAAAANYSEEGAPRKSIRIKVQNDEALRKRKASKAKRAVNQEDVAAVANTLKSPSSPAGNKLTRYPRAPAPPRPLVPRRQPSYTLTYSAEAPKKTLIIDLDETLIHSMAKGGRMSTGHMVEVRLGGPVTSSGVQLGPGVPILYYVHERPGCHDFLRKICKWYNLIVFTASVQEYADPVIDWLERERKYFSGRYYRQHCTFRNGAYIKDLAQVEPDLSKVMILDNSPMSYIFHEDNAIPIEGWISDPTDNDLLHLVPLLEGLQYVTDVRALLALRQGQAQQA